MDFKLTKDQELIRKSIREFLEKECPKDRVRELQEDIKGYDPKMWKKMVKLGYTGLVIPEAHGGTEGEFLDLMVFQEEAGRNIAPCPFFPTVVLCSLPILEFGSEEQKEEILPKIAEKGEIWTFAQDEQNADKQASDIQLDAKLEDNNYVLNGSKLFVPFGNTAKKMLVAARTGKNDNPEEGITLFIVDAKSAGISYEIMPTTAKDMRCQIDFDNVKVPNNDILGDLDQGWKIIDYIQQRAAVLKAAEMSGGAQAVLDIIVKYSKERKQFNKQIGSFQAIQHRLVDLLTDVDGLKSLVYEAAWKIGIGESSNMLNSMAKTKANTVYHRICYQGIVIHGAIGWTEEMDIGLYHLRTRAFISDAGNTDLHLEKIAGILEQKEPMFKEIFH